jgi:hypothetical protein
MNNLSLELDRASKDMNVDGLIVDLVPREDKNKNTYYIGKIQCPANLNCSSGIEFLISLRAGEEKIQIAAYNQPKTADPLDCSDFVGKIRFPGTLSLKDGLSFFVYISSEGEEELQISQSEPRNQNHVSKDCWSK